MTFNQFIKDPVIALSQSGVFAVQAPEYPLLFMRALFDRIEQMGGQKRTVINLATIDLDQVQLRLSMSFLGQKCLYWLGDIGQLSPKNNKQLLAFLSGYQGEHTVVFYTVVPVVGNSITTILCPEKIDYKAYETLVHLWETSDHERCRTFMRALFERTGPLTLEQAVKLTGYACVLGSTREQFVDTWADLIVTTEQSLFELSGLLFARDPAFWDAWQRVQPAYEFPFWCAYFSELLFRASGYIAYKKAGKLVEAKKMSYRLPFSFIQRDWQKLNPALITAAHEQLTEVDFQLKNGAHLQTFDNVFITFFVPSARTE